MEFICEEILRIFGRVATFESIEPKEGIYFKDFQ